MVGLAKERETTFSDAISEKFINGSFESVYNDQATFDVEACVLGGSYVPGINRENISPLKSGRRESIDRRGELRRVQVGLRDDTAEGSLVMKRKEEGVVAAAWKKAFCARSEFRTPTTSSLAL